MPNFIYLFKQINENKLKNEFIKEAVEINGNYYREIYNGERTEYGLK